MKIVKKKSEKSAKLIKPVNIVVYEFNIQGLTHWFITQ